MGEFQNIDILWHNLSKTRENTFLDWQIKFVGFLLYSDKKSVRSEINNKLTLF